MVEIEYNQIEENKIQTEENSPLDSHGKLTVKSGKVIDKKGKEFIIQGISTHSIHEFSQYINYETFKTLKEDFNINTIRLAMYTEKDVGYSEDLHLKIDDGVKYAFIGYALHILYWVANL